MLPYIYLFGYQIPVYGVCFFSGIIIAVIVARILCRNRDIEGYDVVYSSVITSIGAVIGAKLLFLIISLKDIIEYNVPLENVIKGGFVFYGGLIGGVIALYIYVKNYKLDAWEFFDLYATVLPLGHAIGRIGCFFGGCCYGIEYDGPFHYIYTVNIGNTPLGVPLLPIQLVESFLLFVLFAVLCILYKKISAKGTQIIVYGVVYSIMRFVLEFFRGDKERGFLWGMSTSQVIAIFVVVAVLFVALVKKKRIK